MKPGSSEEAPKKKKSSRISTALRLAVAFGLFAAILALVPIRDRLTWEAQFPSGELVGSLEHHDDGLTYEADDGTVVRFKGQPVAEDSESEGMVWDTAEIRRSGEDPVTIELNEVEQEALAKQPEQGLRTTLKNLDPLPFLAAILFYMIAASLSFHRWHVLLRAVGVEAKGMRVLKLGFFGLFFSNILPGMTGGDLVKAVYVARDHKEQRPEAVLSVIVDRAIGLFGLALLAAFVLLFNLDDFRDIAMLVFALVGVMVASSSILFSRRLRRVVRLESIIARLPAAKLFQKLDKAVLLYRDAPRAIAYSIGISLLVHTCILTSIGMVGVALGLKVSFSAYYALAPLPLIIQSVPLLPAGIGVGEWAFVLIFSRETGLLAAQLALALALSYRAVQLIISLVGGVLLGFDRERKEIVEEMESVGAEESDA